MNVFTRLIKHCATGIDGETYDIGRILLMGGALIYLGCSIYHVWKHGVFDYLSFGGGYGGLLTTGAAALKIKETTEPKGKDGNG